MLAHPQWASAQGMTTSWQVFVHYHDGNMLEAMINTESVKQAMPSLIDNNYESYENHLCITFASELS